MILHETHSTPECEKIWRNEWGGEILYAHGTSAARGIAVCVKKQIFKNIRNVHTNGNGDGRVIIFDVIENDQTVSIAAIYAPNEDKPVFFENLRNLLKQRNENKIILGDFNLALNPELDRCNTYCNNNKCKIVVEDIMNEYCMSDVWRVRNPLKKEYSWFKKGNIQKASRIDFALVSGGIDQKVENPMYIAGVMTDHRALYLSLDLNYCERGTGYWKLNTQLLTEKEYIDMMNEAIQKQTQMNQHLTPTKQWEAMKTMIKNKTIKYSTARNTLNKIVISQLSERVNEYEARLPLNQEEYKLWQETKLELEEKLLQKVKGNMFRSKVRWYEEGEKNTKYFFSLEKARYNAKTCYKVIDDKGVEHTQSMQILQVQKQFYDDLYKEDKDVKFDLDNKYGVFVPQEIKLQQDTMLQQTDLEQAIKGMKNSKTPGSDGIPADFYKIFWNQIKHTFLGMVNQVYQDEILHESARQGILNLIPKADKDTRYVKNLRPITLLNVDYKIIEKAVANKMIPALEHIIHRDQRGFMKNRRISVNIRKMLDIIHEANVEDLEAVILSLDFVKCFDKCSFSILHGSLEFFDFGKTIKHWTKILYRDFTVKIQNNGHFSQRVQIRKGVHQGGCCSSIYFLVIAEILALALRQNEDIESITIREIKNLLNQFADDMDIFSKCTEKSVNAIFNELNNFYFQSGFEVSYDKTTLYRIGSLRHTNAQMYNKEQVKWSNQDINVLGVTISHQDILMKNYGTMPEKVWNIMNSWQNRGLSLLGKVQVINSLVASLFVYKMMVLPTVPNHIIKNIECKLREFLWNGKKAKISLKILQNPKHLGGLGLVNLLNKDKALKATWPQILNTEQHYADLVYSTMRMNTIRDNIWRCNISPKDVESFKMKNTFWKEVLQAWGDYNTSYPTRIENQMLWYNSNIKVKGKPIMWKDTYDRGLLYIHQLYEGMELKTDQQVWEEFGLTKLRFNSIKVSLPWEWKNFFVTNPKSTYFPLPPTTYDIMLQSKHKASSLIYSRINGDFLLLHNKYNKWTNDIGQEISSSVANFAKLHQTIYRTTNVTKYRSFQYRLLQRGLVTNIQLHRWKLIPSNMCTFCKIEEETILHLFYYCPEVQTFWKEIMHWVQERFSPKTIDISPRAVITSQICNLNVVNFISICAKQYIYRQRCMKDNLQIVNFKLLIKKIESIEKYIAIKNGKLSIHLKKWKLLHSGQADSDYVIHYVNSIK